VQIVGYINTNEDHLHGQKMKLRSSCYTQSMAPWLGWVNQRLWHTDEIISGRTVMIGWLQIVK